MRDYKYKHTVNLLSLFLYGSSAISEEKQKKAMEYFDPELWNLFYNAPSDEAYTYRLILSKRILKAFDKATFIREEEISLYLPLAMSTLYLPSYPSAKKSDDIGSHRGFVDASGDLPAKETNFEKIS